MRKRLKKYQDFAKLLGSRVKTNESLAKWTTLKIGGGSDLFYVARKPQDLIRAVAIAIELDIPYFLLGGGSNLLVSDRGFRGLVIKNECRKIRVDGDRVVCQSGALLKDTVSIARRNSLRGLEFAAGIWGTVGGAVYGNAGAFGKDIGDVVEEGIILTSSGDIKTKKKKFFEFGYRHSKLKGSGDILLSVVFKLRKGSKKRIEDKIENNLAQRRVRVPLKYNTAGCYFKNPKKKGKVVSAGKLLEEIGAKYLQVGDAAVYNKHANIVVNLGKAKAKDIKSLADILKRRVKKRFNVNLREEVVFLGWRKNL